MTNSLNTIMSNSYFGVTSGFFNTNNSSSTSTTNYMTEYANITSGAYSKLMKAYYGGSSAASSIVGNKTTTPAGTAADRNNAMSVRNNASSLKDASLALLDKGKKSVFNKKSVTDDEGNTTQEYDMESIYNAVKAYADSYNSVIDAAAKSNNNAVLRGASNMVGSTKANDDLLEDIGIKINADNSLSIDKDILMKADVNDIKSLFNGTGSYAYGTMYSASQMYNQSVTQLAQLSGASYSASGSYNYTYTGSLYSSYL